VLEYAQKVNQNMC